MGRSMNRCLAAVLVLVCLAPGWVRGQEKEKKWGGSGQSEVSLTLNGASIEDLVKVVQKYTNKVFLYPERIRNTRVYAKGTKKIPMAALYPVFESILALHGYTVVPTPDGHGGEIIKIVTSREAMWRSGSTFSKAEIQKDPDLITKRDKMVTLIYPLRYAQAQVTMNSLRQLINPNWGGYIQGIANVEVLIISDFGPNVRRIAQIIELMDVPGPQLTMSDVVLQNATAEEVIRIVSQLMQAQTQSRGGRRGAAPARGQMAGEAHFIADERTNTIILLSMPHQAEKIRTLIRKLDLRIDEENVGIHMVKLRHTDAEDMEEAINAILDAKPTLVGSRASGAPASAGPQPPRSMPRPAPSGNRPRTGAEENRMAAIADKVTNSIIVVAPQAEFREIKKVIERLDVRRPQVLVEVEIVEVNMGSGMNLGVELTSLDGTREKHTRGFGATQWGFSNMVDGDGFPILPGSAGYARGRIPSSSSGMLLGFHRGKEFRIPLLLTLLGNENEVNIMAMPHIVTADNKKAEIRVLNKEPTTSSSSNLAVQSQVGFSNFEEAGIKLEITPHISSGEYLRLEIIQEVSQFSGTGTVLEAGGEVTGILPPGKNTNEIKSVITVPNNQTVIIGGLMSTKKTKTVSKVPFLGDIPLLGYLFKRETTDVTKSNIYIFITPHILRDPEFRDYERLSSAHLDDAGRIADTSQIDRHYRGASRIERSMLDHRPGTALTLLDYRQAKD